MEKLSSPYTEIKLPKIPNCPNVDTKTFIIPFKDIIEFTALFPSDEAVIDWAEWQSDNDEESFFDCHMAPGGDYRYDKVLIGAPDVSGCVG